MIYGYARVSTKEHHPDREIIAIKKFCEDKNMTGVKIYVDKITGKNLQRPEYMKLRRKIKAGDTLIIHELDRLGRKKKIF